jgi:2'-5' RNA ligase
MSALVLIPAHTPPLPDDAHLTLVWPGDAEGHDPQVWARLAAMVHMFSQQHGAFPARVMGTAMFGANHDEPVLLVQHVSQLMLMRAAVQSYSRSEFIEFRPHVAVPGLGRLSTVRKLPKYLYFNQISFWPSNDGAKDQVTSWLCG